MEKITVFGDIHGRTIWKDIVNKEKDSNLFVFLGDYVTTHELISEEQQFENFKDILDFKENNLDKVILLRGNHDLWNFSWGDCWPCPSSKLLVQLQGEFARFKALSQWIYMDNKTIFSHSGVSLKWLKNNNLSLDKINKEDFNEKFGFTPDNYSDSSGTSRTQPPTWIRPQCLVECAIPDYIQVVGHTPVKEITNLANIKSRIPQIWLCDCLPKQYLIIKHDTFIVKNA